MFRVLIEWLRQPRVKNWNNAFLAKTEMNDNLTRMKKMQQPHRWNKESFRKPKTELLHFLTSTQFKWKTWHPHVPFFKDFRFKNLIFRFIHRVSAFTLSLPDYDTKELFNVQFPPTISIYSSANSFGE